ncbi:hypothetical protein FN846DRAFT_679339 [Sphaerosporella brunnea]|uniref:Uncharacterized protein n=1 Tax=Sphaerosporella brunnea TaxID=1250544 RepID=A0A5J5EZD4_9PEZI|nr:hypothetical protein FN846DRAFT_679339 [Sphaerosporella brunnea]
MAVSTRLALFRDSIPSSPRESPPSIRKKPFSFDIPNAGSRNRRLAAPSRIDLLARFACAGCQFRQLIMNCLLRRRTRKPGPSVYYLVPRAFHQEASPICAAFLRPEALGRCASCMLLERGFCLEKGGRREAGACAARGPKLGVAPAQAEKSPNPDSCSGCTTHITSYRHQLRSRTHARVGRGSRRGWMRVLRDARSNRAHLSRKICQWQFRLMGRDLLRVPFWVGRRPPMHNGRR